MNNKEKCIELRNTIAQLYSKEGRSISYISRLLEIDRKTLSITIREWGLPPAPPARHATPSTEKFIHAHKQDILSMLMQDTPPLKICEAIHCERGFLKTLVAVDTDIKKEYDLYWERRNSRRQERLDWEAHRYDVIDLPGEQWSPILGYSDYMASNMGRIRGRFGLMSININPTVGRAYVSLRRDDGVTKTLNLARVIAATFCDGKSNERNTVNHIDGNTLNNVATNLEWVSQSENLKHSYDKLNRQANRINHIHYTILYQGKYEFKTVAAFARFLGLSETQTRRYIDDPSKHNIQIIPT